MSRITLTGLAFALAAACVPPAGPGGAKSGIAILVDISRSFAPLDTGDLSVLRVVGDAGVRLAKSAEQPVKVQWWAITSESRRAPVLCGGPRMFRQMLTGLRKPAEQQISNAADLNRWLSVVCPDAIVAMSKSSPSGYTDVSGAIAMAADSMTAVAERRYLLIFSDFLEDRHNSPPVADRRLDDYRVLLVWRAGVDSLVDMDDRLSRWRARLEGLGADVCTQPSASLTAEDIVSCLRVNTDVESDGR